MGNVRLLEGLPIAQKNVTTVDYWQAGRGVAKFLGKKLAWCGSLSPDDDESIRCAGSLPSFGSRAVNFRHVLSR